MDTVPESVLNYLGEKHTTIIHGYRHTDGLGESCGLIAEDIERILASEGLKAKMVRIQPKDGKVLKPKIEGSLTWGGHLVCSYGDFILDPIVGKPILKNDYSHAVFGEDVSMTTL